ncbi:MAG: phosphotransferase [Ilumatobacteraceae bacterium]
MDLFAFDPPEIDPDEIVEIAARFYGVTGGLTRLRGERSHNTLIAAADGTEYVLKIASTNEPIDTVRMHAAALIHLEREAEHLPVARIVRSVDGDAVPVLERADRTHAMRLVTHLPGVTFGDRDPISTGGLRSIGALVGAVSAALADFDHPSARHFVAWDIASGLIDDAELWDALAPDAALALAPARSRLDAATVAMRHLPRQVIHNDGHAGNLLRSDNGSDRVTGIIDFGDLVHTITVADLAVAGANLALHQADPVAALVAIVDGFRSVRAVSGAELSALPDLVLCRLVLSTLLIEHQIAHAPHIAGAVAAERPGLLADVERWLSFDPDQVIDELMVSR